MNALRLHRVVEQDGQLLLTGIPYRRGQVIDLILLGEENRQEASKPQLTAQHLLHSPLVGLWKDRTDIADSSAYARQLREQAQHRR